MKNKLVITSLILVVACLALATGLSAKLSNTKKQLDEERYTRMLAEEKLNEASRKANSLESDLAHARNQAQSIQAILEKEKATASSLKSELEKAADLNQKLAGEAKNVPAADAPVPSGTP